LNTPLIAILLKGIVFLPPILFSTVLSKYSRASSECNHLIFFPIDACSNSSTLKGYLPTAPRHIAISAIIFSSISRFTAALTLAIAREFLLPSL